MRAKDKVSRGSTPAWIRRLAAALVLFAPALAGAQGTEEDFDLLRLKSTPIGALPPISLPMAASRNHSYWGARLQAGHRRERHGPDLLAVAAGLDFQYRGGSTIGFTGGFQDRDCDLAGPGCGRHAMYGARARIGVITGGSSLGGVFGDYSATNTLGGEIGIGYAPNILPGMNACTIDLGLPYSVSLFQRIRVVTYITPGVVWDVDCSSAGRPSTDVTESRSRGASYLGNFGIGLQQFGAREIDIYLGVQRIFRGNSGYQFGITVTYLHLP